jgi:hypothetical protein
MNACKLRSKISPINGTLCGSESGNILTPGSGMGKNQDTYQNSERLETIFYADQDPDLFNPGWKDFGSGINIPDPHTENYIRKNIPKTCTRAKVVKASPQKPRKLL